MQCTTSFKQLVKRQWPQVLARSRGFRNIKGKGLMETYFLYPPGTPSSTLGPSVLNEGTAGEGEIPAGRVQAVLLCVRHRAVLGHARLVLSGRG